MKYLFLKIPSLFVLLIFSISLSAQVTDSIKEARKLYDEGLTFYKNQEYEKAIGAMKAALNYNNQLDSAYIIEGKAEFDSTTNKEYFTYFNLGSSFYNPIRLNPKAEYFAERGDIFLILKDYNNAVEDYDSAIVRKPNVIKFYNKRGYALLRIDKAQEALNDFDKAINLGDEKLETYELKADGLVQLEKYSQALEILEWIIEQDSNYYSAYYGLGLVYGKQGDIEKSIQLHQKAIEINPDYVPSYNSIAVRYMQTGKLDEAKSYLLKALEVDDRYPNVLFNMILITTHLDKDFETALIYNERLLEVMPDAAAYSLKGATLMRLNRNEEAVDALKIAIELDPEAFPNYVDIATCFAELKREEEALKYLEKVVALCEAKNIDDASTYSTIGYSYSLLKKYNVSIKYLDKSIGLDIRDPYAFNNRAFCKIYLEDLEGAKIDAEKSKNLDPNNSYVYFTLAGIAAKEENKETFYRELEKAIELGFPIQDRLDEAFLKPFLEEKRFNKLLEE